MDEIAKAAPPGGDGAALEMSFPGGNDNSGSPPRIKKQRKSVRSRLEARWAAFFDLLKWEWHYEPFDLNGWIPDFVLHGKTQRTLVEVKPVAGIDDPLFTETTDKIEKSGWEGEALIVSYFLPLDDYTADDDFCVGWLCEVVTDSGKPFFCWALAPFQVTDNSKIHAGFCHRLHSYRDRITDYHPGGRTGANNEEIKKLWAQAGNAVQWRGTA